MKAIEQEMLDAVNAQREWRKGNTSTHVNKYDNYVIVRLYGKLIAVISPDEVDLRDGGWQSVTTKSRLNAIASHFGLPLIHHKDKIWYIGDEVWTGSAVFPIQL